MTMLRQDVIAGTLQELVDFESLLRSLSDDQWGKPTRCEGWTVADVAAHTVGTVADIAAGRFAELAGPTSPSARQVAERKGRSAEEVADELQQSVKATGDLIAALDDAAWAGPAPGGIPGTLGEGVEAIWYDTYVHGDDIRAAIGRPSERGLGLRASVEHLASLLGQSNWGPAELALEGIAPVRIGNGDGRTVTGDPL